MTEYLSKTSYWQTLEDIPVTIKSSYRRENKVEKTANAKALGDEFIRLYQFSIDLKKMRFPIEPRIELTDSTGEYWGMLVYTSECRHHPIVLARPKRFKGDISITRGLRWDDMFLKYEAWYLIPKETVTVTGLTKFKGKHNQLSTEARSYNLGCYKIFQCETSISTFRHKRLILVSGCTITDSTGTYKVLLVMTTTFPKYPVAITINERSIND